MREFFISFVVSLIFFGLFVYCLDNLQLFNSQALVLVDEKYNVTTQTEFLELFGDLREAGLISEVLNKGNFTAMCIVVYGLIFFSFGTLHLFIDKMFFKKFYEKPNIILAVRRSIIFTSALFVVLLFRVFGFFDILGVLFIVLVSILIEMVLNGARNTKPNGERGTENVELET